MSRSEEDELVRYKDGDFEELEEEGLVKLPDGFLNPGSRMGDEGAEVGASDVGDDDSRRIEAEEEERP